MLNRPVNGVLGNLNCGASESVLLELATGFCAHELPFYVERIASSQFISGKSGASKKISYLDASSRIPCSSFSWHSMQCRVHGTASRRLALISLPQEMHSPKLPSRMRTSALSTICKSCRSLLLWLNRNSLV